VTSDRHKRFRHLERPRTPGEPGAKDQGGAATGGRFGALEERRPAEAPAEGGVASGHLDRFRPAAERPLEVAPAQEEGALPFIRCASCQMDHNRAAAFCNHCGADLRTEVQRAFNASLAAERRAQSATEAAEVEAYRRGRAEAESEAAKARRAMGELMAREVGNAERRRLDAEGLGGGFGGVGLPTEGGWQSGGGARTGWQRVLWVAGWILLAILRALVRPRWRRW
jgi:hypothetical protein